MMFIIAKAYAYLYLFFSSVTGLHIPGLGFLLRLCKKPRLIKFSNEKLYFEPTVAASYGIHIINRPHEPETHIFLNFLFDQISCDSYFIDVGANIGIFMVDLARRDTVHVIGFEPSSGCIQSIEKSMAANGRNNFSVFNNLVGDKEGLVPYEEGADPQGASVHTSYSSKLLIKQVMLDNVTMLKNIKSGSPVVLMVDVEGYEPNVLRGSFKLIENLKPLIIFEYNFVSKQYFKMNDVKKIIGDEYDIFRLRKDALLDCSIDSAWNCVAVPRNSEFERVLKQSICAV